MTANRNSAMATRAGRRKKIKTIAPGGASTIDDLKFPPGLSRAVRKIIDQMVATQADGHFRKGDEELMMSYAVCVDTLRRANEMIEKNGLLIYGARGDVAVRNPALIVRQQAQRELRSLSAELWLSPTARQRREVPAALKDDPMWDFLGPVGGDIDPAAQWATPWSPDGVPVDPANFGPGAKTKA